MIIILFGAPGVGKGTQASILADKLGVAHLSTGEAFRSAIRNETEVGILAKTFVDAGDLVPDDVVARIVEESMLGAGYEKGAILDGFPRTQTQADALNSILDRQNRVVYRVVNIEVDDASIIERLLARGRADDTEDVIQNRLEVYRTETAPLLEYYRAANLLVTVNGLGPVDEIGRRIVANLE